MGLFLFVLVIALTVLVIGPYFMGVEHRKQKAEKLAMMREFPHMAPEIYKSIEQQEALFREDREKYNADLGRVFSRPKKQPSEVTKTGMRAALSIAKKLMK